MSKKTIDIKRLRNLTTMKLHTKMEDIYEDIEFLMGTKGISTIQLPSLGEAINSFLKKKYTDEILWNGLYMPEAIGEIEIEEFNEEEKAIIWKNFEKSFKKIFEKKRDIK